MKRYLFIGLILGLTLPANPLFAGLLTGEEIDQAKTLAKATVKFEEYTQTTSKEEKSSQNWLTLEDFKFGYKGKIIGFYVAHSFNSSSQWGELAIYPDTIDPTKISLTYPGSFSDLGKAEPYLARLQYEYISAAEALASHFIIEHVNAGYQADGKGYSQAILKYFLDEFVAKRTDAPRVFSDLRAKATQHYFPKYGFKKGNLSGYEFKRGLQYPYHWVKADQ